MITATIFALALLAGPAWSASEPVPEPGQEGGAGLALKTQKILTCAWEGPQVVDNAVCLVKDGKITAVGRVSETPIPDGYTVVDLGDRWLAPGMVELHCHEAGVSLYSFVNDLNDVVYLANPGCAPRPPSSRATTR